MSRGRDCSDVPSSEDGQQPRKAGTVPRKAGTVPRKAGTVHGAGSPSELPGGATLPAPEVSPAILTSDIWAPALSGSPFLSVVIRCRGPRGDYSTWISAGRLPFIPLSPSLCRGSLSATPKAEGWSPTAFGGSVPANLL